MSVCGCQLSLYQRLGGKPLQRLDDDCIALCIVVIVIVIVVILSVGDAVRHFTQREADVMLLHSSFPDDGAILRNFKRLTQISYVPQCETTTT